MDEFVSYPRTHHLEGSRLQPGDRDDGVRLRDLPDAVHVWEEKLDGANSGVSFVEGELRLQSRGHFLTGGARERQFGTLKAWASENEVELYEILGERFVLFQEWMAATHSVFYDSLPCLGFEEDIWDKERGVFLSTEARNRLLFGSSIKQVPVLHWGKLSSQKEIESFIRRPWYQTLGWKDAFLKAAEAAGDDPQAALARIDQSGLAEGLYLKVEDPETRTVIGRYKWVRPTFLQTILESGSHWSSRPMIRNRLQRDMEPQEREEAVAQLRREAVSCTRKAERRYARSDRQFDANGGRSPKSDVSWEEGGREGGLSTDLYRLANELKRSGEDKPEPSNGWMR